MQVGRAQYLHCPFLKIGALVICGASIPFSPRVTDTNAVKILKLEQISVQPRTNGKQSYFFFVDPTVIAISCSFAPAHAK